jgi:hypothetical protein
MLFINPLSFSRVVSEVRTFPRLVLSDTTDNFIESLEILYRICAMLSLINFIKLKGTVIFRAVPMLLQMLQI